MNWIPMEKRRKETLRRRWYEGVEITMRIRHVQVGQRMNRNEWCFGTGR
jgi:hypothetical protein